MGFYRIYWKGAYVHECSKEMVGHGYDIEENDVRLESLIYFQEYEDDVELTKKIKNYIEGYYDAKETIKRRVWMMRTNAEYYKEARGAYEEFIVK